MTTIDKLHRIGNDDYEEGHTSSWHFEITDDTDTDENHWYEATVEVTGETLAQVASELYLAAAHVAAGADA
jgi:hypothetical protein